MPRPTKPTEVRAGTKTYKILSVLFDEPRLKAKNYAQLSRMIEDVYDFKFGRRKLGEVIKSFNEGLYIFNGLTVEDTGKLDNVSSKCKRCRKKKKELTRNKDVYVQPEFTLGIEEEHPVKKFEQLCEEEGIDPSETTGGWVKTKNLSVRIKRDEINTEKELNKLIAKAKEFLKEGFDKTHIQPEPTNNNERIGVVHIADLHIGAYVEGLLKTPDFNVSILEEKLKRASDMINGFRFEEVHVQIYGDLIESFTGLNHPNSWKEMEQGVYGVEAVKIAVETISKYFLDRISNVSKVFIIGGNHDRVSSNRVEDSKGGVANLVAYCLDLKGYDVKFNPLVLTNTIGGIHYIMLHGDKGVSKRGTKEIIWDYGKQGKFNMVVEGHLHNRIQKLTTKAIDGFKMITDDSVDCRRQILPSVFTGNSYSNDNNWFANSGFVVTKDNGYGLPLVIDIPL